MNIKPFLVAVVVVGVAGAASAATVQTTLDFTSSAIDTGSAVGAQDGVGYSISASPGTLTDATHYNDNNCGALACDASDDRFDVGFAVSGKNSNEIDGGINADEYVQIAFTASPVRINGFSGALMYTAGSATEPGTELETVLLDLYFEGTLIETLSTDAAEFSDAGVAPGRFDTVGLATGDGSLALVDMVRFRAGGTGTGDDGSLNVTAASLTVTAVPLPAAGWMLLAGIGGMAAFGRRRQKG